MNSLGTEFFIIILIRKYIKEPFYGKEEQVTVLNIAVIGAGDSLLCVLAC